MNWINELYTIPKFKKYSQSHEEGYLQHILNNIKPEGKKILELGAWDGFHLSNTRYFIEQGYKALLIDGDNRGNEEVKQHFITKENIHDILKEYSMEQSFDLLCIDLDGNDFQILEKILSSYKPSVIIAEFNPIHEPHESKVMAYDPNHTWSEDNYYGFSFAAGMKLAHVFHYTCIFQNDNLNMYFVEDSKLAESLNIPVEELAHHVPPVNYTVTHYHPPTKKTTNWINY